MLRQDIYIHNCALCCCCCCASKARERERETRLDIFFCVFEWVHNGRCDGQQTSRTVPIGERIYKESYRDSSVFFHLLLLYIFLRFLCWVGRRRRRRPFWDSRSHLAIVYISHVPFFFFSFIRKKKKENDRREYIQEGFGPFIYIFLFLFFFLCIELRLVFISVSHSLATPQPININDHLEIRKSSTTVSFLSFYTLIILFKDMFKSLLYRPIHPQCLL